MNWKELKEFANSLDEAQLEKEVLLWREDESISNINTENLSEDYYISDTGEDEGCYPESEASEPVENLKKAYSKGDPILWENF